MNGYNNFNNHMKNFNEVKFNSQTPGFVKIFTDYLHAL